MPQYVIPKKHKEFKPFPVELENGRTIYSAGFAVYICKDCGTKEEEYWENSIRGVVKCPVCGASVILDETDRLYGMIV